MVGIVVNVNGTNYNILKFVTIFYKSFYIEHHIMAEVKAGAVLRYGSDTGKKQLKYPYQLT
jgi:hypothetical protein